mgnify:CR=1 FL=1
MEERKIKTYGLLETLGAKDGVQLVIFMHKLVKIVFAQNYSSTHLFRDIMI